MIYLEIFVVVLTIFGAAWTSYMIGINEGGARMIEMLETIGIIKCDENENVVPNKDYKPKQ
jgi:hypothetical protein|tara:strand:- start:139 stop:321 length:183 start_codon:yes stop_codon:yes gene_type:complete